METNWKVILVVCGPDLKSCSNRNVFASNFFWKLFEVTDPVFDEQGRRLKFKADNDDDDDGDDDHDGDNDADDGGVDAQRRMNKDN